MSQWCYPIISSSVVPFSSRLQSFPASGSFLMTQFFTSGGQSVGVSASASVLPKNIQDWFPLGWTGWISAVQGTLKRLLQHHRSKASILQHSAFFIVFITVHRRHYHVLLKGSYLTYLSWNSVQCLIHHRLKLTPFLQQFWLKPVYISH